MKTEWAHKKLIDLADYYNGMAFKPSDWVESGTKIIRIEQLNNPLGNYDYYQGSYPEINAIHNEDLIFSWSATLKVAIWKWGEGVLNQHLFKVVPFENVDKYFLYYLLDYNMPKLGESSHGSTMKHIKRKELETYSIKIPTTLSAQRHIAAILTSADKVIASTQQLIAKYKSIKQGLMEDLLKPKEGWKMVKLGEFIELQGGFAFQSRDFSDSGVPLIRIGDITPNGLNISNSAKLPTDYLVEYENYVLNINDTVIAMSGATTGKCTLVTQKDLPALLNQRVGRFRIQNNSIDKLFLYYIVSNNVYQQKLLLDAVGGAQPNVSPKQIESVFCNVPILSDGRPNLTEQRRIAAILSGIDAKIAAEEKVLEKYEKVKKGLMERMLEEKCCSIT